MNICDILVEQIKLRPNAPAVYSLSGNLTYAELGAQVANLSAGLAASGVKEGGVVALRLDDAPCHLIATLAVGAIGATVLSVPRSMPEAQRDYLFAKTNCKIMLSGVEYANATAPIGVSNLRYSEALANNRGDVLYPVNVPETLPWIYATGSGSTGRSKVMPITHGLELRRVADRASILKSSSEAIVHSMSGISFLSGKRRAIETFYVGGALQVSPLSLVPLVEAIATERLHILYATPFHMQRLLDQLSQNEQIVFPKLQALYLSAATISPSLRKEIWNKITKNINILYGTNECSLVTIAQAKQVMEWEKSIGHVCNGTTVEIVNSINEVLPVGEIGEIRIKTPHSITGYIDDSSATQKAFRDGWFYPGDLGQFLPDGQLLHLGRADNMMIISGVNLYPAQVENCLRKINGVKEVIVRPLPHKSLQDLPCALVVAKKGVSLDAKELLKKVHDEIGGYALYDIEFVERLPFNEQGKLTQNTFVEIFQRKWTRTSQSIALGPSQRPKAEHDQEFGTFKLKIPEAASSKMLAYWVKALDPELPPLAAVDENNRLKSSAYAWVAAVLDLVVSLGQALRMPIFERFDVVGFKSVADSKNVFSVTFRLPAHDLIPADLLEQLLKLATSIASWTLGKSPNNANQLQQFFQIVQDNVRVPFSDRMSRGKSTFHILHTAHKIGIPYFHLPNDVYQLGLGRNARRIQRSTTDCDSALGAVWSKNKFLTNAVLLQAGMPVPQQAFAHTSENAAGVAQSIGYPVVVKPADLERGEGVSVDVGQEQIAASFELAQKLSPRNQVVIEQQIAGVCHRLFVVGDTLLYAVKRLPMGVYADGMSTIKALVDAEFRVQMNLPPWKRSGIQRLDELAQTTLAMNKFASDSIPKAGTFVALRRIETTSWGGVDEDVTLSIHPENVKLAVQTAKLCGLDVAGVDLISKDVTQPWFTNGAAINEINFAPLLGGGEISKKHIGEYLRRILVNQGRIPAHVYEESPNSVKQARAQWNKLRSTGLNAYFISETDLFDGDTNKQYLSVPGLEARVRALVLRNDVQGIVVVAKNTNQVVRLKRMLGTRECA